MNPVERAYVMQLQARIAACHWAVQQAREELIERLGDHLCGGDPWKPCRSDLKALARARLDTVQAERELARFLLQVTLSEISRRLAHGAQDSR